jgi:hypothetical protein
MSGILNDKDSLINHIENGRMSELEDKINKVVAKKITNKINDFKNEFRGIGSNSDDDTITDDGHEVEDELQNEPEKVENNVDDSNQDDEDLE